VQPILDPRRGDFEDDALSTKRRSLLSLFGKLLVEISLPKLAIVWLFILVIPSVLLGLAPLVATIWWSAVKWKFDRTTYEIWSVVLLAAVVALGWYGGRKLWRLAESSFWSLNALAVEPIYLIVRESLRHLVEKWLAASATDDQYRRYRAAAAAAAGFLIGALALAALAVAWPYSRWWGTTEDLAAIYRLPPVAVANSVVLVSAYLAIAALVWGIADATMAQPRTLEEFASAVENNRIWRIAHLSDVHVVGERYGFRMESGRSGPRGNARFRQVVKQLASIHAKEPLDIVLMTGDMTDAGRSAEWAEFFDALLDYPQLTERVLLLPGNHDLNVADRANPARLELPTSPNRRLRQLRMLCALNSFQGDRVRVVDESAGVVGKCLTDAIAPRLDEVAKFADTGRPLFSLSLTKLWHDVFPLVLPPETNDGLGFILLDSNADTQFSFTSALGMMSTDQVRKIKIAARQYPSACWVIALHHQLIEYPRAGQALADRIGTVLINGNWFLRRLKYLRGRAIVMHGHRHIDWIGQCAGLTIISAPSPVMESGTDRTTCFYIHSLSIQGNRQITLLPPQRISVAVDDGAAD
jgi:hypothetical protein